MTTTISTVAGLLFLAGFIPYFIAILRRKTKPSKTSWLIWAALDFITLGAMYKEESVNGLIIGACIGASIAAVLAWKFGTPGWSALDLVCLAGAGLGLILWYLTEEAVLAILTSQLVTVVGAFPTFGSAWKNPRNEDRTAWALYFASCIVALFAIPAWTIKDAAQPLTFLTIETIMIYLVWIRPLYRSFPRLA